MAIKTFTTGEILTAADTNTYLNNGGLVYVSSGSFSNSTSVDITGFTTLYKQFRVVISAGRNSGSGTANILATYRSSSTGLTSNYYGCGFYMNYLGGTGTIGARNNGADMQLADVYNPTTPTMITFDVAGMNTTTFRQTLSGSAYSYAQTANIVFGYDNNAGTLASDRIRITCTVGMDGFWRVYGYREP
jgi:hypothetical protein